MGAPVPEFEISENPGAEALLSALKTIPASDRREHATIFNYWLSIRGDRQLPPIRDLDPLEISDAGPHSLLLEIIGEGEDAEIRHLGSAIKGGVAAEKISEAAGSPLLSCIAAKLPIIAAGKRALAFEDEFDGEEGPTCCWVTLLPFGNDGSVVEFVYGFVSLAPQSVADGETAQTAAAAEVENSEAEAEVAAIADNEETELLLDEVVDNGESAETKEEMAAMIADDPAPVESDSSEGGYSGHFSELLKSVQGFYGRVPDLELDRWQVEEVGSQSAADAAAEEEPSEPSQEMEASEPGQAADKADDNSEDADPVAEEPEIAPEEPQAAFDEQEAASGESQASTPDSPVPLHDRLAEVRVRADEARLAKLHSNIALYEGLGAAYDFALDAEDYPEDYLKMVEAQGLKIRLRSPMAPVVRLAFAGMCDEPTIRDLEAVLAWAFKQELPRGTLAQRIQDEGGIGAILGGLGRPAG